jgi:hypothetical protein
MPFVQASIEGTASIFGVEESIVPGLLELIIYPEGGSIRYCETSVKF